MNKRITLTMKAIKRLKVISMVEEKLMTRAKAEETVYGYSITTLLLIFSFSLALRK
jgi:ribosomal protein S26